MLLRESSKAIGESADLSSATGAGDGGLPNGSLLLRFAEAATRGSDDLEAARDELLRAISGAALVEAAATIGIFNGLVRVADGTGIPLDDGTRNTSVGFREELGLNVFGGAANSDLDAATETEAGEQSVQRLFS